MIYAYDQWIPMPVKDIYDTKVMAMAIDAAKDMYEKGEQAIKDFKKEYGDFSTQLPKDAEFYKREFDYGDFLNSLYDRGIDPTRSVEGRAELNKWLYSRPYDTYNRAKKNAEVYDEYLKNRDKLRQAGLYDEDQERYYFPFDPNLFSSEKGDVFNRYSPVKAKTLEEITSDIYKGRTPYELSKEEVESFGVPFDPRAKYTGYSYNALLNDAGKGLPGLQGTPGLDYFKDLAKRKLINAGITNPTDDQVNTQLQHDVADANLRQLVRPTSSMSDWINMQKLYAMRSGSGGGRKTSSETNKTSYGINLMFNNAISKMGNDPNTWVRSSLNFAKTLKNQNVSGDNLHRAFLNRYVTVGGETKDDFMYQFDEARTNNNGNLIVTPDFASRFMTTKVITSNTRGYYGGQLKMRTSLLKKKIEDSDSVEFIPSGDLYTSVTKLNNVRLYNLGKLVFHNGDKQDTWNVGWLRYKSNELPNTKKDVYLNESYGDNIELLPADDFIGPFVNTDEIYNNKLRLQNPKTQANQDDVMETNWQFAIGDE